MIYKDPCISGWMLPEELQWLYHTATLMKSIIEIGSWCGKSTHALLTGCKGQVTAVDKWDPLDMVQYGNSEESYKTFCKSTEGFPNLTVLKMDSIKASKMFEDKSVEMIFIDGLHDGASFGGDLDAWLPKAKKIICGHDLSIHWPDIQKIVERKFGKEYQVVGSIWIVNL